MVRIALYSEDRELQRRLSGSLGKDFEFLLEHTEAGVLQLLGSGACGACILHLSSCGESIRSRFDFARRLIEAKVDLVIAADEGFEWSAVEIVHLGARGYFRNDGVFREVRNTLARALQGNSTPCAQYNPPPLAELFEYTRCDGLIGSSPVIQNVTNMVRLVADINVPVFVTGESGTGKELIARAIHNLGNRADQPFVAVSCGAIPETLLEAELFGHEKGAFTGTVGARQGHFEEAATGTLFLDEIGDLSHAAQVKLLRVLQQREFRRLGSNRLVPLRARIIFATHQDLDEMVARGAFRQDLYYRINVVRINAPPLREHPEDIPQLAAHFLDLYARTYNLPMPELDPEALALMQAYAWPGNVRELEHIIQSAIILCRGEAIRISMLPDALQTEEHNVVDIGSYLPDSSFEEQLAHYKVKLALAAVRQNNGNKTLAARSLNISRAYLHRLLRVGGDEQIADSACSELEAI